MHFYYTTSHGLHALSTLWSVAIIIGAAFGISSLGWSLQELVARRRLEHRVDALEASQRAGLSGPT